MMELNVLVNETLWQYPLILTILQFLTVYEELQLSLCSRKFRFYVNQLRNNDVYGIPFIIPYCQKNERKTINFNLKNDFVANNHVVSQLPLLVLDTNVKQFYIRQINKDVGLGLFSKHIIPIFSNVLVYFGEIIHSDEVKKRQRLHYDKHVSFIFLFYTIKKICKYNIMVSITTKKNK